MNNQLESPSGCPNCKGSLQQTPLGVRYCMVCLWIERKGETLMPSPIRPP